MLVRLLSKVVYVVGLVVVVVVVDDGADVVAPPPYLWCRRGVALEQVNGRLFKGDVDELLKTLRGLIGPLVVGDETLMSTVRLGSDFGYWQLLLQFQQLPYAPKQKK